LRATARWLTSGGLVGFDVVIAARVASCGRGLILGVVKIVVVRIAALCGDFSRDDLHDWRYRPDFTRRSSRPASSSRSTHDDLHNR